MRSKEATPYICRRECIQHETVFVAARDAAMAAIWQEAVFGEGRASLWL